VLTSVVQSNAKRFAGASHSESSWTLFAAVAVLALTILRFADVELPEPRFLPPPPETVVVLCYAIGGPLALCTPAVLFLAWSHQLFRASERIPARSIVLLAILAAADAWVFSVGWDYGIRFQGRDSVMVSVGLNAVCVVGLFLLAAYSRTRPSFRRNLLYHAVLFSWLAVIALPYLGEWP
jgi:hypothetical protein